MKKPIKPKAPPIFLVRIIMCFIDFLWKLHGKLLPPQAILFNHLMGDIAMNRCVYVAAELGIADFLKDGPKSIEQLAVETRTDTRFLYRLMRTLSSIGIFKQNKKKQFETNKVGEYLQSEKDGTIVLFTKAAGREFAYKTWNGMLQSVKNGRDYYTNNHGINIFKWLEKNPEIQKEFNRGMISGSALSDIPVTAAYNFSPFDTIIDVGGGCGSQLIMILKAYPKLKGTLFDLPLTIEDLKNENICEKSGLEGRLECIGGDFLESVPAGFDAYFMKNILHDWDDEDVIKILTNCRKAMRKDSTLIVIDNVIKENNNKPDFNKFLDVNLMVMFGGSVRTRSEWSQLFETSGLKIKRFMHTASPFILLEAKPI